MYISMYLNCALLMLQGHELHKPKVIGSATEGALVILTSEWGINVASMKNVRNIFYVVFYYRDVTKSFQTKSLVSWGRINIYMRLFYGGKEMPWYGMKEIKYITSCFLFAYILMSFGALVSWQAFFTPGVDHEYPFNSAKKRSSVLIRKQDGTGLRLYSKGASETSELLALFSGTYRR